MPERFATARRRFAVKVRIDHDLCEGNARCQQTAPDIFELRDDEKSYVLVEEPGEDRRDDIATAFRLCPKAAVSVTG